MMAMVKLLDSKNSSKLSDQCH